MKKIAIITATRAEYGLLTPLIQKVNDDEKLELDLIVTGTHLSEKQGYTIDMIRADGFSISHEVPILEIGNTPYDISLTISNAIKGFAKCFLNDRPDMVVILGDRTEMLGVAVAAMNERIPIAHIHGGEVTEGAVDDCIRHALTKMSYLHFASTEVYRKRIIQLGEEPKRVFNVGGLGTENILNASLLSENNLRREIGLPMDQEFVVVTFHPVTLEDSSSELQAIELCQAMDRLDDFFYLITKANADAGGDVINKVFENYSNKRNNVKLIDSLGMIRYLSAIKYANFVLGNSSSGILEAPVIGTPTVNIGERQKGRLMAKSIVNSRPVLEDIICAMKVAATMEHHFSRMYGDGITSAKILKKIKEVLFEWNISLKKGFYDWNKYNG